MTRQVLKPLCSDLSGFRNLVIGRGGTDVPVVDAAVYVWLVLVVVRDPRADYADPDQAALLLGELYF